MTELLLVAGGRPYGTSSIYVTHKPLNVIFFLSQIFLTPFYMLCLDSRTIVHYYVELILFRVAIATVIHI